jgi:hypothetical protein
VIVVGHCGAPVTPLPGKRIPYLIRDHIHSNKKWFGPDDIPTATTVDWPADEPCTVIKFDVYRKKASVYTGKVLDGNALFVDFANCICRNKMLVQIDNPTQCYLLPSNPKEGAFRNWWGTWGCHQVVFYGNLRQQARDFANLTGFAVVESEECGHRTGHGNTDARCLKDYGIPTPIQCGSAATRCTTNISVRTPASARWGGVGHVAPLRSDSRPVAHWAVRS